MVSNIRKMKYEFSFLIRLRNISFLFNDIEEENDIYVSITYNIVIILLILTYFFNVIYYNFFSSKSQTEKYISNNKDNQFKLSHKYIFMIHKLVNHNKEKIVVQA